MEVSLLLNICGLSVIALFWLMCQRVRSAVSCEKDESGHQSALDVFLWDANQRGRHTGHYGILSTAIGSTKMI
jgi:hypothetical protein